MVHYLTLVVWLASGQIALHSHIALPDELSVPDHPPMLIQPIPDEPLPVGHGVVDTIHPHTGMVGKDPLQSLSCLLLAGGVEI